MKLIHFNQAHWGVLEGDQVVETAGPKGAPTGRRHRLAAIQLSAPAWPSKLVCSGPNYRNHVKPGEAPPSSPQFFLKAPNAVAGPDQPIVFPSFTSELCGEVELAVVMAKRARRVTGSEALACVLGYTIANDLTAKDAVRTDLQWVRGKSTDGFCPLGPWLETELDPQNLIIRSRVNGELKQEASTATMLFPVARLLSEISQFMTLDPGDVILTGSPKGAPRLQPGDTMEVEIEGIGVLRNRLQGES